MSTKDRINSSLQNVTVKRGATLIVLIDLDDPDTQILNLDLEPGSICVIAEDAHDAERLLNAATSDPRYR